MGYFFFWMDVVVFNAILLADHEFDELFAISLCFMLIQ